MGESERSIFAIQHPQLLRPPCFIPEASTRVWSLIISAFQETVSVHWKLDGICSQSGRPDVTNKRNKAE
jgi:hypothetical protein